MLIALVFFLICTVVGVVVVSSASVNVERNVQHEKDEQAYYAVTSAARLVPSLVATDSAADPAVGMGAYTFRQTGTVWSAVRTGGVEVSTDATGIASWALASLNGSTDDLTLTVDGDGVLADKDVDVDWPEVTIVLTMDPSTHAITAKVTQADADPDYAYTVTVLLDCNTVQPDAITTIASWEVAE